MGGFSNVLTREAQNLKWSKNFEPRNSLYTRVLGVQRVCDVFRKSFIESTQTWYYTTRMNIFFNTLYEVVMLLGNNDQNSEFPDQIWGSGALNTLFLLALQPAELSTTRLMRINLGSKTHLLFKFQVVLVRTLPHPWIYLKRPFLWLVFLLQLKNIELGDWLCNLLRVFASPI